MSTLDTVMDAIAAKLVEDIDLAEILKTIDYNRIGAAITAQLSKDLPELVYEHLADGDLLDKMLDGAVQKIKLQPVVVDD